MRSSSLVYSSNGSNFPHFPKDRETEEEEDSESNKRIIAKEEEKSGAHKSRKTDKVSVQQSLFFFPHFPGSVGVVVVAKRRGKGGAWGCLLAPTQPTLRLMPHLKSNLPPSPLFSCCCNFEKDRVVQRDGLRSPGLERKGGRGRRRRRRRQRPLEKRE